MMDELRRDDEYPQAPIEDDDAEASIDADVIDRLSAYGHDSGPADDPARQTSNVGASTDPGRVACRRAGV